MPKGKRLMIPRNSGGQIDIADIPTTQTSAYGTFIFNTSDISVLHLYYDHASSGGRNGIYVHYCKNGVWTLEGIHNSQTSTEKWMTVQIDKTQDIVLIIDYDYNASNAMYYYAELS